MKTQEKVLRDAQGYELGKSSQINTREPIEKVAETNGRIYRANPREKVFVKSNLKPQSDGGNPVAHFERLPNGKDIFISGDEVCFASLTQGICDALNAGNIVEASESEIRAFVSQQKAFHSAETKPDAEKSLIELALELEKEERQETFPKDFSLPKGTSARL